MLPWSVLANIPFYQLLSLFRHSCLFNKEILMSSDDSRSILFWHFLSSLIKKPVWRDSSCRQHLRRHLQRPGVSHFVPPRKLLSYIVTHLNTASSVSGPESVTTLESRQKDGTVWGENMTFELLSPNGQLPLPCQLYCKSTKHPDTRLWKSIMWISGVKSGIMLEHKLFLDEDQRLYATDCYLVPSNIHQHCSLSV